jgi:hypothetical protein
VNSDSTTGTAAVVANAALRMSAERHWMETKKVQQLDPARTTHELISCMTIEKARARVTVLRSTFPESVSRHEEPSPTPPPPQDRLDIVGTDAEIRVKSTAENLRRTKLESTMALGYSKAIQFAALVVVSLPMSKKSLPMTQESSAEFAETYGELVWRGWTLAIASPTKCSVETESRFRQFALGLLYQAKCGYVVPFQVSSVTEYIDRPGLVDAAIAREYDEVMDEGEKNTTTTTVESRRDWFAKRHAISFIKMDHYLVKRLVKENRIGQKGTVVDGVQAESVTVNGGISLVEEALSEVAEWLKRRFVIDIVVNGMDPDEAIRKLKERNRNMKI